MYVVMCEYDACSHVTIRSLMPVALSVRFMLSCSDARRRDVCGRAIMIVAAQFILQSNRMVSRNEGVVILLRQSLVASYPPRNQPTH